MMLKTKGAATFEQIAATTTESHRTYYQNLPSQSSPDPLLRNVVRLGEILPGVLHIIEQRGKRRFCKRSGRFC